MPRFFTSKDAVKDGIITVKGGDAFHIARSLRMAVGDEITVCDGEGAEYFCRLTHLRDDECLCKIETSRAALTEMGVDVTLFMAYPKGDKLETVVQKAVELGARRIVPFESSRCIKRPKADKAEKTVERLNRIAHEAAKQCGRARLPEVSAPVSFSEMIKMATQSQAAIFCYEAETETTLKSVFEEITDISSIAVVIGCEGGFSQEEAKACIDAGMKSVSLGRRILRCETAPVYFLSAISYRFEL